MMRCNRPRRMSAVLALLTTLGGLLAPIDASATSSGPDPAAWNVLGAEAQAGPTRDADWSRDGRAAVDYRYRVGKGQLSVLVLPTPGGALGKASGLSFFAKSDHMITLAVALEEQGGGRWTLPVVLNAGAWQKVQVIFDDMVLATGGDAPADANGRLDVDRVARITVVDVGAMLASTSSDIMRLFDISAGARRLAIADMQFDSAEARTRTAEPSLDGFDQPQAPWSVFGATRSELASAQPLTRNGLVVDYDKKSGAVMSLIRALPPAAMAGATALDISIGSRMKAKLVFKLEQSDGGKFETAFELPGDSRLQDVQLKLADFKRSDDSGTRNAKPDAAKASNLILLDVGGLFASKGNNRLWLQRVAATGASTGSARAGAAAKPAVATTTLDVAGWSSWTKREFPLHSGPYSLVGDPSVMRDGDIYRMFYNCFETTRKGGAVCQATSTDGFTWNDVPVSGSQPGLMIAARKGKWDDTHETPLAIKYKGEYLLYFSGYRNKGGFFKSFPAFLGLAVSRNGVNFERVGDEPILKGTPGGWDSDAVFSPSIVEHEGQLVMLYTGYCFDTCKREPGVYLMAATSTNGRDWVKRERPVLSKADLPQTKDGAAEADLVKGPDGRFYLFMSLLYDKGHDIGLASAPTPYGPWEVAPSPIVKGSAGKFDDHGPIAPSVLIEDRKVRMWYHGFSKRKTIEIGYAEAPWPLRTK